MVLSLGSLNLDLEVRVERLPGPDDESLRGREFLVAGGGRAANVAFFAAKLGVPSVLLARMGQDVFGRMALSGLERVGVDLRHVRRIAGEATGVAMIAVRPNGDETMLYAANANEHWSAQDAAAAETALADAPPGSVLVIDLEPPAEVTRRIAQACRDRRFKVILDPAPPDKMQADLYALCHCITPNRREAAALSGLPVRTLQDAWKAGNALRDRGAGVAFVKMHEGGCVMVDESGAQLLSPPKVAVIDKTGAGDAFAGALAVALVSGRSVDEAGRLAVAASAAAVSGYGAQPSYPDRPQLERLLTLVRINRLG
jgi:ribokinase